MGQEVTHCCGRSLADGAEGLVGRWLLSHWPMAAVPRAEEFGSSRPARDGGFRHLSPNHSVAMPRNEKNPTTSVTVVTNTPDEIAGSAWKRWSTSGTRMPPSAPAT